MKNVAVRAFTAQLQPDPHLPGVFLTALGGLPDGTTVTVHDVTPIDGETWFATISLTNEEPFVAEPEDEKPTLHVVKS